MMTLHDHLAAWLDHARSLRKSPRHLRQSEYMIAAWLRWLEPAQAVVTADRLRIEHMNTWIKHLRERRTAKGLPLKPSSVNRQIEAVRTFVGWMAQRGLVPSSFLAALTYVAQPRLLPTSVLNHAQMRRALAQIAATDAPSLRDRAMLEMLYSSGVRASELLGLNVADVDLGNATAIVMGKGEKQRVVPIGKTALRHLESYLKGVRPLLVKAPGETALWLNARGERLSYASFLRRVHAHLGKTELPVNVTPHTFRRSCTTELIRGGANLWHVKELLGHEQLDTIQHYAKLTITDLKKTHAKCHPREKES